MKKQILAAVAGVLLAGSLAAGAQIVVRIGPPPPPVRWVWVGGHHRWDGARYVWVPGYYAHPPRAGAFWVPGHWAHRGGGYVWVEGHWR
jgi:hypothetical protein